METIKLGFVLSVAVSFPLVIFPCRTAIHSLVFRKVSSLLRDEVEVTNNNEVTEEQGPDKVLKLMDQFELFVANKSDEHAKLSDYEEVRGWPESKACRERVPQGCGRTPIVVHVFCFFFLTNWLRGYT